MASMGSSWPISGCARRAPAGAGPGRGVERGGEREPLVRRGVLHEAEQLRAQRRLGQRLGAAGRDARGHLDDVVRLQAGEAVAVADVDHLHVAVARRQRAHELRRRLAVVRAAAPLQQRRLLPQRRVAIQLEQLALDGLHLGGARRPVRCSASTWSWR